MNQGKIGEVLVGGEEEETAADLVNRLGESSLSLLFQEYGDVPMKEAKRVARLICIARPLETTGELSSLIVDSVTRARRDGGGSGSGNGSGSGSGSDGVVHYKKSPATKYFQSLRIAVNDELSELNELLMVVPNLLCEGGKFAVISFHSLEDRRVKRRFKEIAAASKMLSSSSSLLLSAAAARSSDNVVEKKTKKKFDGKKKRSKKMKEFEILTKKPMLATSDEIKRNPRARSSRLRVLQRNGRS